MYTTHTGNDITLGTKIAKGGEGEVYSIVNNDYYCVKIYYDRLRTSEKESKLKYMCQHPPANLLGSSYKICWPLELIYKDGQFVGFMMSKAFEDSSLPYHLCQPVIPKRLDALWHKTFDRKSKKGVISRLKLCTNIVAVVNRIHETGNYVLVDLKPQNILVTVSGKVSIIDMDSVQITENSKVLFKAPVSTPEYTPPEANEIFKLDTSITSDWDVFSLGVIVYEILCGIHPYVGTAKPPHENLNTIQEKITAGLTHVTQGSNAFTVLPPPHKNFNIFSSDLRRILKKIFSFSSLQQTSRPSLNTFGGALFNAVNNYEENIKKEAERKILEEKIRKEKVAERKRLKEKLRKEKLQKEAIENYDDLKIQHHELQINYKENSKIIQSKDAEIATLTKQINTSKPTSKNKGWLYFFIILACFGFIYGLIQHDKYTKAINDKEDLNFWMDRVRELKGQKLDLNSTIVNLNATIDDLQGEISNLQSENSILEKTNSQLLSSSSILRISEISFSSNKGNGNDDRFVGKKNKIWRSQCYYLYPTIKYEGKKFAKCDIYVKYIDPNGEMSSYTGSPKGYTLKSSEYIYKGANTVKLDGYGNDSATSWDIGSNTIEIWIKDKKIYTQKFWISDF